MLQFHPPSKQLYLMGALVLNKPKQDQITVEVKNRVEPAKNERTCLNWSTDI
jgi:hypothetical protein